MSAGLWDKHLLHKAGIALDRTCERCGNIRDDTYHRFWECTALESTFDEVASLFQDFRKSEPPACLTSCGLAMELAGDVTGAFWIRSAVRDKDQLQRKRKYDEWEQLQCDMQVEGKTARRVLADYHGPDRILDIQLHQKIQSESEPSHTRPNTFTDASVLLPRMPWAAYAGMGIVHIDRDLITEPIHSIEEEMTEMRSDPARRYGTMSSAINNSTRMELTAAIIATYTPRPITIAIVNQAAVKGIPKNQGRKEQTKPLDRSS